MDFNFQPTLRGTEISARPLSQNDLVPLRDAASDPLIWAGHPAKNRHEPDVFDSYFAGLLNTQRALVVEDRAGRIIGCSCYYVAPDGRNDISIGFTFLTRDHWGGNTNFELKHLMLGHIFTDRRVAWFHIDPTNIRSQTATSRLGATHVEDTVLDLGTGPLPWKCYRITKPDWQATVANRNGGDG